MQYKTSAKPSKSTPGFTMPELLVVIIITAILAAIAVPIFTNAIKRSYASDALSVLYRAAAKQEVFLVKNGRLAAGFTELSAPVKGLTGAAGAQVKLGFFTYSIQGACIMAALPKDDYTIFVNAQTLQEACFGPGCHIIKTLLPAVNAPDC